MGVGAFIEPLVVVSLLFGGTWINRNRDYSLFDSYHKRWDHQRAQPAQNSSGSLEHNLLSEEVLDHEKPRAMSPSLRNAPEPRWRKRPVRLASFKFEVVSPNTRVFQHRLLSRLLLKFPFLVEAWYWALIYWVYQLGRAFTAVNLVEGTVHVARRHALQVIRVEQRFHIFWELHIQHWFLAHPDLLHWINRIYSFIHIPGTILFLVWLYYYTTTRNRPEERHADKPFGEVDGSPAGPRLYEARRRTMAVCNLLAFIVFTAWPCMPPRLLSDKSVTGPSGVEARRFGFVDTVHGVEGESSVWTQNRFCNQYAAMPSLHFGYALMIGLTISLIPLSPSHRRTRFISLPVGLHVRLPNARRLLFVALGMSYSLTILTAIIATANHFILDAVAGAVVCGLGWWGNKVLLNLVPVEDYFLWCLRIHKPDRYVISLHDSITPLKLVFEDNPY